MTKDLFQVHTFNYYFFFPLTAPCPPSGVKYSINASFITVAWNSSVFATTYTVYDASVSPNMQLCTTVELSCSLPIMSPSSLVVTASNDAGESQPENVVKGGNQHHIYMHI